VLAANLALWPIAHGGGGNYRPRVFRDFVKDWPMLALITDRVVRSRRSCRRSSGVRMMVACAQVAALILATPAPAAERTVREPAPPTVLPGDARAAALGPAKSGSWLVGAQPGRMVERAARRFQARLLMPGTGIYRVAASRARSFARALRAHGGYRFSEPDSYRTRYQFPFDPLTPYQWGLPAITATALSPPPVVPWSPLIAVIEDGFDVTHPDMQGVAADGAGSGDPAGLFHGTAVASVASAPVNGAGITGVWPGARTVVAAADGFCGSTVEALYRADAAGAAVINMSYGFPAGACFAHYVATQRLFGSGAVLVAAAGNEFQEGNPTDGVPASSPHVITVSALNPDLSSAGFSNRNLSVDVAAPGVDVLAAVPAWLDQDGVADGYQFVDGTSFSAPMVAAAAAWISEQRPSLDNSQVTDLIRYSASDLGPRGYDPDFGFGALDLPTALSSRAPSVDLYEPNDDAGWVDGRYFGGKDPPIYRGRRVSLSGRVDALEDPADTFRVIIPGRRSVRIQARPTFGDPALDAYNGWVRTVWGSRGRIVTSDRRGRRTDTVEVYNPYRRRITIYAVLWTDRTLAAGYRLTLRPTR
jgi:hypothetical protein